MHGVCRERRARPPARSPRAPLARNPRAADIRASPNSCATRQQRPDQAARRATQFRNGTSRTAPGLQRVGLLGARKSAGEIGLDLLLGLAAVLLAELHADTCRAL